MSRVAVLLAEGFEEVEAVTPIDFLRRAGVEVVVAGLDADRVTGSHGISISTDTNIESVGADALDGVVLPGGMPGAVNLASSSEVRHLIQAMVDSGKMVAAICAAPAKVLAPMGVLSGRRATCFPGDEVAFASDVSFTEERVVTDGSLITSRGAGSAAEFAEAIIGYLVGTEAAYEVHVRTVQPPSP